MKSSSNKELFNHCNVFIAIIMLVNLTFCFCIQLCFIFVSIHLAANLNFSKSIISEKMTLVNGLLCSDIWDILFLALS